MADCRQICKRRDELPTTLFTGSADIPPDLINSQYSHLLVLTKSFLHTGYIPGAAASGYLLMKMMKIVLLTSHAAMGLGGHQSKKKSI